MDDATNNTQPAVGSRAQSVQNEGMSSTDPQDGDDRTELTEQADFDLRFAQIVAAMGPDQEDGDAAPAPAGDSTPPEPPVMQVPAGWRVPDSGSHSLLDEEFEPPDLDDLPEEDFQLWAIIGALVGGPLWIAYLLFLDPYAGWLWWALACALIATGLVMLVLRQPWSRDPGDDDGAIL